MSEVTKAPAQGPSWLRRLAYFFMIVFFVLSSVAVFTFITGLNATKNAIVDPVTDLFQQLSLEVTPEIVPDPSIIVQEVKQLARLETASIALNQVVTAEKNNDDFWGIFGESLIFVSYGEAVAGVDLALLDVGDIQVLGPDSVMIHLPEAEMFNQGSMLNTELSYVADRDEGLFAQADPQLETAVRQTAEAQLQEAAVEMGILDMAQENAQSYMTDFLNALGFEEVIFTDSPPPPAPPYQQEIPKGSILPSSAAATPVTP